MINISKITRGTIMREVIYKRKNDYIVDRDMETSLIYDDITSNISGKVNIVYSHTALGKSTLSKKILNTLEDTYVKITVKTVNQNNRQSAAEGEFFSLLFKEFEKTFQRDPQLSLDFFLQKNKDFRLHKEMLMEYFAQWSAASSKWNVLISCFLFFAKKWLRLGHFDVDALMEKESILQKKVQSLYIKEILKQRNCVIVFENFQNIDHQSFEKLLDCLAYTCKEKNYFIFEYTLNDNRSYEELQQIEEYLTECGIETTLTPLEMLDPIYLSDFVDKHFEITSTNINFKRDVVDYYKNNKTGNLRQIIDFSFDYCSKENNVTGDATINRIKELSDVELTVLYTIVYINESFTQEDMEAFWETYKLNRRTIQVVIKELRKKQFIDIAKDNKLVLSHASINDALEKSQKNENIKQYASRAYAKIIDFYLAIWERGTDEDRGTAWEVLFRLYSVYEPNKMWPFFDSLRERLFITLSPENAWKYINIFVKYTKKDGRSYINQYISILNICFEFELYKEAYNLLEFVETLVSLNDVPELAAYKCMYLSALDRHEENIQYYNSVRGKYHLSERCEFTMKLCVLSSYRSLAMREKWQRLYLQMLKNKEYCAFEEYGYLLRLSDMYFDRIKALPLVKKSVRFFQKKEMLHQAGKSLITAAHLQSGLGRQYRALHLINKAEKLLDNKIMGRHMILVNKAVILLLKGKRDSQIIHLLEEASISATVPFDKLAIIVNRLAWMIVTKDFTEFNRMMAQGERCVKEEPDKHIHALFYYNVYYIYKLSGNVEQEAIFLQKTQNLSKYCIPVKERLLNTSSKNNSAVLKRPFHICFLSYWTFDILL